MHTRVLNRLSDAEIQGSNIPIPPDDMLHSYYESRTGRIKTLACCIRKLKRFGFRIRGRFAALE